MFRNNFLFLNLNLLRILFCLVIFANFQNCKFSKKSALQANQSAELDDCLSFTEAETLPELKCSDIPETPRIRFDFKGNKYKHYLSSNTQNDPAYMKCLNPNSILVMNEEKGLCHDDGGFRVATLEWENTKKAPISMIVQCTSFSERDRGFHNIILVNKSTKNACFLRVGRFGLLTDPDVLVEKGVSCVGCHQPFLLTRTPLILTDRIENQLELGSEKMSYVSEKKKFDGQVGALKRTLGVPDDLVGLRYQLSEKTFLGDPKDPKSKFLWKPVGLDFSDYSALKTSCGPCHKSLGAHPIALNLASVMSGHCLTVKDRDAPCLGFDMARYSAMPEFQNLHKLYYQKAPFKEADKQAVFDDLSRALKNCKSYHGDSPNCKRIEIETAATQ